MKVFEQEEIDKAAEKHANYVVSEYTPTEWSNQQLKNLIEANFKGAVSFAKSKVEEIVVEFGEYLLDNVELFDEWSRCKVSTDYCFKQFLKERNET